MLTPRRHRDPGYAASIAGEIYGGSLRGDPSRASELLHPAAPPGPGKGYYYQLLAAAGWTSLPLLPLLRPPTLILAGDDDPLTPAGQRADNAPADPAQRTAHLPRRPPRPHNTPQTHGHHRGGLPEHPDRGPRQHRRRRACQPRQVEKSPVRSATSSQTIIAASSPTRPGTRSACPPRTSRNRRRRRASRPVGRVLCTRSNAGRRPSIWDCRCRQPRAVYPRASGGPPSSARAAPGTKPVPFDLAPGGVYQAARITWALVVSYTTVSPLPRPGRKTWPGRSVFCGTVPRVTPGRRYRPPCPAEPGPSSPAAWSSRRGRPAGSPAAAFSIGADRLPRAAAGARCR